MIGATRKSSDTFFKQDKVLWAFREENSLFALGWFWEDVAFGPDSEGQAKFGK